MRNVFSVYDNATKSFAIPFFEHTKGSALRGFMDAAADPKLPFLSHPHDFVLFHLGEFDQATGRFSLFDAPDRMGSAAELIPANKG